MTMVRQPAGIYVCADGAIVCVRVCVCVHCGRFTWERNEISVHCESSNDLTLASDTWRWQLEIKLLFHMTLRLKLTSLNVFVRATMAIPDCKMDAIHLCSCPERILAKGRAIESDSLHKGAIVQSPKWCKNNNNNSDYNNT